MTTSRSAREPFQKIIPQISHALLNLSPGPLADLRRMRPGEEGAAFFWKLAARHDMGEGVLLTRWQRVVQAMALLMPKGEQQPGWVLHDPKRSVGAVLCDGGQISWSGSGRGDKPILSEQRLARLLAARGRQREMIVERVVRMLARSRDPHSGINCVELAKIILFSENKSSVGEIARNYYYRLDIATAKQEKPSNQGENRK
ncbi:MAG: hypothetical protein HQL68_08240 [Magnetococcales bacterium]|nr:hypothetical protein [Magnetococcales bacterium]